MKPTLAALIVWAALAGCGELGVEELAPCLGKCEGTPGEGNLGEQTASQANARIDPQALSSRDGWYPLEVIDAFIERAAINHPELVRLAELGVSGEGRPIRQLVISAGPATGKPVVYLDGGIHGDEKISTGALLHLVDKLTSGTDPAATVALSTFVLHVVPVLNPDGYHRGTRRNGSQIDLNRDYPNPSIPAPLSLSAPETRAVKELLDATNPVGALTLHSSENLVLYPWCYPTGPTDGSLRSLAAATAAAMGASYTAQQCSQHYTSAGEFIDFAYRTYGTLALTMEIMDREDRGFDAIDEAVRGVIAYLASLSNVLASLG